MRNKAGDTFCVRCELWCVKEKALLDGGVRAPTRTDLPDDGTAGAGASSGAGATKVVDGASKGAAAGGSTPSHTLTNEENSVFDDEGDDDFVSERAKTIASFFTGMVLGRCLHLCQAHNQTRHKILIQKTKLVPVPLPHGENETQ